jgi:hypothetical protein
MLFLFEYKITSLKFVCNVILVLFLFTKLIDRLFLYTKMEEGISLIYVVSEIKLSNIICHFERILTDEEIVSLSYREISYTDQRLSIIQKLRCE